MWKDPAPRTVRTMQEAIAEARKTFAPEPGEFVFYTQSEYVRDAPGDVIVGEVIE